MDQASPLPQDEPLCQRLQLTATGLQQRLDYLRVGPGDLENLATIHAVIDPEVEAIVTEFYDHLEQFAPLQPLLGDATTRARLRATLHDYLLTLGQDPSSLAHAERRLRVGAVHERIGLAFPWYLGGYPLFFQAIVTRLARHRPARIAELSITLHKAFTFDAALAVEIYHRAGTDRLEEVVQQLARAQQELKETARLDALTGALNRGAALESLEVELHRGRRFGQPLSLLVIDIDHFKAINDTRGHAFGDQVLAQVVQACHRVVRPWDIVGRLGGDELVIGLLSCRDLEAWRIAERIRLKVVQAFTDVSVTLSIGVVTATATSASLAVLLEAADAALYLAKQGGRNCTRAATAQHAPAHAGESGSAD